MYYISQRFCCFLSPLHHNYELEVTRQRPCFVIINPTAGMPDGVQHPPFPDRGRTRAPGRVSFPSISSQGPSINS